MAPRTKSKLPPIKRLTQNLDLIDGEKNKLLSMTGQFLKDTKQLTPEALVRLNDLQMRAYAEEFLDSNSTTSTGRKGDQFWPLDGVNKHLKYANDLHRTKIVNLVGDIMANQRNNQKKSIIRSRMRWTRLDSKATFRPASEELGDELPDVGDGSVEDEVDMPDVQALNQDTSEAGSIYHDSPEPEDLPDVAEILRSAGVAKAPTQEPTPSPSRDGPSTALATPPVTPAIFRLSRPNRLVHSDTPHASIELGSASRSTVRPSATNDDPGPSVVLEEAPAPMRRPRRERSPTALPICNPVIPRLEDGGIDRVRIRAWKKGIHDSRRILLECSQGLWIAKTQAESSGNEQAATRFSLKGDGVREALVQLDAWVVSQQARLDAASNQIFDSDWQ